MTRSQQQRGSNEAEPLAGHGILPLIVVRQAGVAPWRFDRLILHETLKIIDHCTRLQATCQASSPGITKSLEHAIGKEESTEVKWELVRLRRDIYNDRSPKCSLSPEANLSLATALTPTERDELNNWLSCRQEHDRLIKEGEAVFTQEAFSARATIKNLVRKREFRKALALASPTLSYELAQYLGAKGSVRRLGRTELALIRYYTRCAFKLSPFSSFMRAGIVDLSGADSTFDDNGGISSSRRLRTRRSVNLNQALLGYLAHRIAQHPELGGYVPVFESSAVAQNGTKNRYSFIERRYRDDLPVRMRVPTETFASLAGSAGLEWVIAYLRQNGGAVPRKELVAALGAPPNDLAQANAYVGKLIQRGVLGHKIPLPEGESSTAEALIHFFESIPNPLAAEIRRCLEELRLVERRFATANPEARSHLLVEARTALKACVEALGAEWDSSWNGSALYEDCVDEPVGHISLSNEWLPVLDDLEGLLSCYGALLDCYASFRETIRHILLEKFNGGPVPFLELCDRDLFDRVEQQWSWVNYTSNPCRLASLNGLAELRREFASVISQTSDLEEIDMRALAEQYRWPERVQQLKLAPVSGNVFCLSCHCQPWTDAGGRTGLVLNVLNNGPARTLLRSCAALPDGNDRNQILKQLRQAIGQIWPDAEPCELVSTFDYNANLHPRLTRRTINYEDNFRRRSQDLKLADLAVEIGPEGSLQIIDRTSGGLILPLDLGMLASIYKPMMQHFLLSPGNVDLVLHKKPFHPFLWSRKGESPKSVERFPRLTFGRCVARRKGWCVPREHLPQRDPRDSAFEYFSRVRRWQQNIGLPDEVFVFAETMAGVSEASKRQMWNRRKPQYIHFGNHMLVEAFASLLQPAVASTYFEEMLPDRRSWQQWKTHRPTELVLDVYGVYDASLSEGRDRQTEAYITASATNCLASTAD